METLLTVIPDLELLDPVRGFLMQSSVRDPERAWDGFAEHSTVDKRIVTLESAEAALRRAEQDVHERVERVYQGYRAVLRRHIEGDTRGAIQELVALAEAEEARGETRYARTLYETVLRLALPLPDKSDQILALRRIARVLRSAGEMNTALDFYERSLELARDSNDPQGEIIALTGQATILIFRGQWRSAELGLRRALERVHDSDAARYRLEHAQILNNLAVALTRQERFEEANRVLDEALDLWTGLESPVDLAICYYNRGGLRRSEGAYGEARAVLEAALSLRIPPGVAAVLATDLANICLDDNLLGEAEHWSQVAEDYALASQGPYSIGHMYIGRGNVAIARNDENAFIFFEKALEVAREKGIPLLEGEALVEYARLRDRLGSPDEAQAYLERAREIFAPIGAASRLEQLERIAGEIDAPAP